MSTHKQRNERGHDRVQPTKQRRIPLTLAMVLAAVAAVAAFMLWPRQKNSTPPPRAADATTPAAAVAPAQSNFQKLKGQWLRPDGGYILDITNVEAGGKMQAGYYNPNSIKVSKAEAAHEGATMTMFIELNDVGYPGSTYTLAYDPANDQLAGVYFQAAMQQSFEVVFVRMK